MRNTRLYIIVSVVVLIIIGIIASILSNQLKKSTESTNIKQNAKKIESTGTRSLSRTEKIREASRITKQSNTSLLSVDQVKRFDKLSAEINKKQNNILTGDDFDIGYSPITNRFYVQNKSGKSDEEFKNFLRTKNVLDIYETDPSLFIILKEPLLPYIKKQEEYIVEELELEGESFPEEKTQSYEEIKKQNREKNLEVLKKLASSLFSPSTAGVDSLESYLFDDEEETESTQSSIPESVIQGIIYPPNLGSANSDGYYMMPPALNNEYTDWGWNSCDSHKLGSKTLVGVIYTVAQRWHQKYPNSILQISDLNGVKKPSNCTSCEGHSSHGKGVDVDISTSGGLAGYITGPVEANIDLGKMFIDTGVIKMIIFGVSGSDPRGITIRKAWIDYAKSKGLVLDAINLKNHDTHFHVRINDQFELKEIRPRSCR